MMVSPDILLAYGQLYCPDWLLAPLVSQLPVQDNRKMGLKTWIMSRFLAAQNASISAWEVVSLRRLLEVRAGQFEILPPGVSHRDIMVGLPDRDLPLRIYRPHKMNDKGTALLFFHGGGMAIGSIVSHHGLCMQLCAESGLPVLSLDYRLAPEHPFPAALEDVKAVYQWLQQPETDLGIAPKQWILGGDSAGGNLVASLMHEIMRQDWPKPVAQVLLYPWTDLSFDWPSMDSMAQAPVLTREGVAWFRAHYLTPDADIADPRLSPLHSPYLDGQPPAYILTCGFDPLRDMGQAYGKALAAAGVTVAQIEYRGQAHAFLQCTRVIPEARQALQTLGQWLQAHALAP